MTYNWQHASWPTFSYDRSKLHELIIEYETLAAKAEGILLRSSNKENVIISIDAMTKEAQSTCAIEGETIDSCDIRASLLNLFDTTARRRVFDERAEGIAALMIDIRKNRNMPLSEDILHRWHSMAITRRQADLKHIPWGDYRSDAMAVVSGDETIAFEAPPPDRIHDEIKDFLAWFNNPSNHPSRVEKSALAHLRFESIHPYGDGNGRVGRAIAEHALMEGKNGITLTSLSSAILADQTGYYDALQVASSSDNAVDDWVNWYLKTLIMAQNQTHKAIAFTVHKNQFWDTFANVRISQRQHQVINQLFDLGAETYADGFKASQYRYIADTSKATAERDLADLVKKSLLTRKGASKSTRYYMNLANDERDELAEIEAFLAKEQNN